MTIVTWLFTHKLLVCLIAATTAFGISTITLGVQKSNLTDELDECKEALTTTTETTTTTTEATTTTDPSDEDDMSKYRLPAGIVPNSYDLYLYPYLESGTFSGKVTISLNVTETRGSVVLHSNKLNITSASIDGIAGTFEVDENYELLTVFAENQGNIETGVRSLTIEFDGDMTNRIVGLYKSTYTNGNHESR